MQRIKMVVLAMLALGVAFTLGCEGRHSQKEIFYLISANSALPYWQTAAAGFKAAGAQYKVTTRVAGPEGYDAQAELDTLQKAVAAHPAGILISVADAKVLEPAINAAIDAGIPVITMDSDAVSSHRLYFIGTNNLDAGRQGGRRVAEKLGGKGRVVFFTFTGQPNTEERLKGFKDAFSGRPEMKIAEVVDIKGDLRSAFDKTMELTALTEDKKIDAFVCLDSASGKVVADAIVRSGATNRLLVAWDVSQDTLEGIKAGTIDATIAQKPYTMAYIGLKGLDEIFHSPPKQLNKDYATDSFSQYPVFVDTGTTLVDKSNVEHYITSAANEMK
jgi:ribose transport system substrate-binding protein